MIIRINFNQLSFAIALAALLAGCAFTDAPPLAPGNPADPHVRSSTTTPRNLLARDQTTLEIENELSQTESTAKSAETMNHDMQGMQHSNMPGMQHEGMKMEEQGSAKQGGAMKSHEGMQPDTGAQKDKKAIADEMKKTSEQMKETSDAMKQKSEEMKSSATIYTCPVHPQIKFDKPGECPICGMTLIKKEAGQ